MFTQHVVVCNTTLNHGAREKFNAQAKTVGGAAATHCDLTRFTPRIDAFACRLYISTSHIIIQHLTAHMESMQTYKVYIISIYIYMYMFIYLLGRICRA